MKTTNKLILTLAIMLMSAVNSTPAIALEGEILTDSLYYKIGGHRASKSPTSYDQNILIGGSGNINANLSCGNFDLTNNLKHLFQNINNSADRAVDALVYAAQSAVAELPFYLLRRADPNLANMLENSLARYEDYIKLSIRSCKEAHRMIMDGENPYADWVKIGRYQAWKNNTEDAEGNNKVSATQSYEEILDGNGHCVRWINDEIRACEEGSPIAVIKEVVERGYGLTTERTGTVNGDIGEGDARLSSVFPEAKDASEWVVQVLGDMTIDNTPNAPPASQPGYGVGSSLSGTAQEIRIELDDAVKNNVLDLKDNEVLSSPGLSINPTMIRALQRQKAEVRETLINKISSEIALLKTMEKINIARDLLMTGMRDPHVSATPAFGRISHFYLPQLKAEYELLRDQYEIKDYVAKSTLSTVMDQYVDQLTKVPGTSGQGTTSGQLQNGGLIDSE